MGYKSLEPKLTRAIFDTFSCPFLVMEQRCAGGDYCPYQPGRDKLCCFFCPRFDDCPDTTGVCTRFTE